MSQSLTTRIALPSDLDRLLPLYKHLSESNSEYPLAHAQDIFNRFSAMAGNAIWLGEVGNDLISSCTVVIVPNLTRRGMPYALIENVVTDAEHRGCGYGRKVLDDAIDHAWAQGCYKIMLLTGSKDEKTHAFYERAGFVSSKTGYQMRQDP